MRLRAAVLPLCLSLAIALPAAPAVHAQAPAASVDPITLEQAMADPDWIGPPVESAWWSWDGRRVYFPLKRSGSSLRDLYAVDADGRAPMARLADAAQAGIDGENPVYDRARRHAAFVRHGDLFVRDLRSGELSQVTRGLGRVEDPRFDADGGALLWRSGETWYRYRLDARALETIAQFVAAKDPALESNKDDDLRALQLHLFSTLREEKQARDDRIAQEKQLRAADVSRAPSPVYLGEDVAILATSVSPDARYAIVVVAPKGANAGRVGKLQKFVTESGYEETEDERTRVGRNDPAGQSLKWVDLRDGSVTDLKYDDLPGIDADPLAALRKAAGKPPLKGQRALQVADIEWSEDGAGLAVELRAVDNKDRWIATVDPAAKALHGAHRLTDPAWINSFAFNDFGWMADGRTLWLLSEQSGFSHLYTVVPGQAARERTHGSWETSAPQFSADGRRAWFVCNRQSPGVYEVCALDLANDAVREVTALRGVEDFSLSPNQRELLVRYSRPYLPPQLATVPADGGAARVLTDTRTAAYKARHFLQPRFVQVPSAHGGKPIAAKLYAPAQLEAGKRYPIVMFVHGAGYLQNVFERYPYYFREQMFNELLVQHGYVVLDMDYRGSAGYGRDWRTAIYRNMGHPELEDYLDGVAWMVANEQGDAQRVGIYGGSYGGFMTLMAMFRAPQTFKAGAAVRPVSDWTQYNHLYTSDILNTPQLDPDAYKASSPIEYADGLQGALLICHGMLDDNVFFQDSVRLAQRLIELHKTHWSLAPYPMESHDFEHADSWLDEYRRIFDLFEGTLK